MLHQPISPINPDRVIATPVSERADRAMDVLQYGVALMALGVVALLAILH